MNESTAGAEADGADRLQMIRRVRAALWAIEHDDQAAWRMHVDALLEWRTQPLVQGLARLARELGELLGDEQPGQAPGSTLPEACARLEHVVRVSEDASHRTLDMIEQCRALLAQVPVAEGSDAAGAIAGIRSRLSEMTAAQGYQDLTGQIIVRVIGIVRCVHTGLGGAEQETAPLQLPGTGKHGHGPAVAGLDAAPATQDDANQLLHSLGL